METEVQEGVPARAADPDGAAGARPRSEAASRGAAQGRARDSLGSTGHAPHSGDWAEASGGGLGWTGTGREQHARATWPGADGRTCCGLECLV